MAWMHAESCGKRSREGLTMNLNRNPNVQQWKDQPSLGYSMRDGLARRGVNFTAPGVAGLRQGFGDKQVLGNLGEKATFDGMEGFSGMLDKLPIFRFVDNATETTLDMGDNRLVAVDGTFVGAVKEGFQLVQHAELFQGLADAFQEFGINPVGHHATTPQGSVKGWAFIGRKGDNPRLTDLPEGHAFTLRFRNGGDGKTGMVLQLGSKVLVCTNDNVWTELEIGLNTTHRNANWADKAKTVATKLIENAHLVGNIEHNATTIDLDANEARFAITGAIGNRALSPLWNPKKDYYVGNLGMLEESITGPRMNLLQAYNAGTALVSHLIPTTDLSALDGPLKNLNKLLGGRTGNLSANIEKGKAMVAEYNEKNE